MYHESKCAASCGKASVWDQPSGIHCSHCRWSIEALRGLWRGASLTDKWLPDAQVHNCVAEVEEVQLLVVLRLERGKVLAFKVSDLLGKINPMVPLVVAMHQYGINTLVSIAHTAVGASRHSRAVGEAPLLPSCERTSLCLLRRRNVLTL